MSKTRIGFIGLGNVGGSLASNLLKHGVDLMVRDLNEDLVAKFVALGAKAAKSPKDMAEQVDIVITCLPSPAATAAVMESPDGILAGLSAGKIWLEMSTTDEAEVKRLAPLVEAKGATAMDWPHLLETFTARRKPNTDAIARMAIENYEEMRNTVRDPAFFLQKQLSAILEERHPGRFIPRYSMVSFHADIPYFEAERRGAIQQDMVRQALEGRSDLGAMDYRMLDELVMTSLDMLV